MIAGGSLSLISHPSVAGIASDSGISGSTQWHNSVRSRMFIKGLTSQDGEPKGHRRGIEFRKNNYGPISEEIVVEYRNGLFLPVTGTTVDQAERYERAEETYLKVLQKLIDQNQDLSASKNSNNYVPTMISEHPEGGSFSKKEMEEAQQRLLDANKIHIADVGPDSRKRKKIVLGEGPL
jgi:RecA-family ATPase